MVTSAPVRSRAASARSFSRSAQTRVCSCLQPRQPVGMALGQFLGDDILARLQLRGAEQFQVLRDALAVDCRAGRLQRRDMLLVVGRASAEYFDQRRPFRFRNNRSRKVFPLDLLGAVVRLQAETLRQPGDGLLEAAGTFDPGGNGVALLDGVAHHVLEGLIGGDHDGRGQCLAERAAGRARGLQQHVERQPVEQLHGGGLVQHGETRRHIGLEGELVQQPGAEGVDGLHLQAARRLQRRGEQPPRARAEFGVGLLLGAQPDAGVERGVIERGPFRQRREHAVRHIGGGRLSEGDAEDLGRVAAAQQQVDHALGQHMRLARAGIGRDEGGMVGAGGLDLYAAHRVGDGAGGAHGAASCPGRGASNPPPAKRRGGSPARAIAKAGGVGGAFESRVYIDGCSAVAPHPRPLPATRCARGGRGDERLRRGDVLRLIRRPPHPPRR